MRARLGLAPLSIGLCIGFALGMALGRGGLSSASLPVMSGLPSPSLPAVPGLASLPAAVRPDARPVLVIVVSDVARVAAVRRAIPSERVLVEEPAGFSVREERLVVASLEPAGPLLVESGWLERPLEIIDLRPESPGRRKSGPGDVENRVADLMNKPRLSYAEARQLLATM